MTWPLEPQGIRAFARGLQDILVVEEKHSFIESQIKELFYNFDGQRPSIVGKYDEAGEWILPTHRRTHAGAHRRRDRARASSVFHDSDTIRDVLRWMEEQGRRAGAAARQLPARAALLLAAARTTPAPRCRKARARRAASVATTW